MKAAVNGAGATPSIACVRAEDEKVSSEDAMVSIGSESTSSQHGCWARIAPVGSHGGYCARCSGDRRASLPHSSTRGDKQRASAGRGQASTPDGAIDHERNPATTNRSAHRLARSRGLRCGHARARG